MTLMVDSVGETEAEAKAEPATATKRTDYAYRHWLALLWPWGREGEGEAGSLPRGEEKTPPQTADNDSCQCRQR